MSCALFVQGIAGRRLKIVEEMKSLPYFGKLPERNNQGAIMKTYEQALPKYLERVQQGETPLEAAWAALWEPGDFVTDAQAKLFLDWVLTQDL